MTLPTPGFTQVVPGPPTTFESGPEDPTPTNDSTPTFSFSSTDPLATFECALDGAQPSPCASPYTTEVLADGQHTLSVRALDVLANPGDWATRTFTVDTTPPDVSIDSGPADQALISDPTPTFGFSSNESGVAFECAVDTGAFASCSSPHTTASLADGPHSFRVRATDAAGNQGTAAVRAFTVDTTGPETVIVGPPPAQTTERTPLVEFVSPEANVTFECSVDGGAFASCTSPWMTPALALGPHRVEVRALDVLGNADGSPALAEFTVAAPPPPPPPPVLNVDAGVKSLAGSVVASLDRAVRRLGTTETGTILRRGGVTVPGMGALVPGALTISAKAPARGGSTTVLRGSRSFDSAGSATIVLKQTRAGRAMMTRYAAIPLLVSARFTTADGLALSAIREAELVRDYLTATEAKRAVARRLARLEGEGVKGLAVQVMRRCASNCLKVQARWVAARRQWSAAGRARQVKGRLLARLGVIVSARR